MNLSRALLSLFISGVLSQTVFATLGAPEASVDKDFQALKASSYIKKPSPQNYSVHHMSANGGTIDEYTINGVVFRVEWSHIHDPYNLAKQLLGSNFSEYRAALLKQRSKGNKVHQLITSQMVISQSGHPGNFSGQVQLAKFANIAIPPGVSK